ncbi:MAG: alpha/beta hydrolase family protein [Nocardioidaceae bacterium]
MDPREVMTRSAAPPDAVVRYAAHDDGLIDVHLPASLHPAARPLVVLLHGGFWRPEYDRRHTRPLSNALAAQGFVVATPEYRRIGAGGWPGTFDDVSAAMSALPGLLAGIGVPTTTTTLLGHSAGGQLALWLASEGYAVTRAVGLAPVADLRLAAREGLGGGAAVDLLGGTPDEVPDRYAAADPMARLAEPPACAVVVVHGTEDLQVPVASSRGLAARHRFVDYRELDGVEHFALIDPLSAAWPAVLAAVRGEPAGG